MCGADEIGHGTQHDASQDDPGGHHTPDQCPEGGGDSCVCRGAVQATDVRATSPDTTLVGLLYLPVAPPYLAPPAHHLTQDGSPTGLASWGGSVTVRAYLQNFRF